MQISWWLQCLLLQVRCLWSCCCCYLPLLSDPIIDNRISSSSYLQYFIFSEPSKETIEIHLFMINLSEMPHLQLIQTLFNPQSLQVLISSWSLHVLHLWAFILLQLFSAAPALEWVILHSHHYLHNTSSSAHCLVLHWGCSREQQSLPSSHTCFLLFRSVCGLQRLLLCVFLFFFFFFW